MRVFKYRGGDWNIVKRDIRSLVKNELYAAPFAQLNDPFEATVVIDHQSFEVGRLLLGLSKNVESQFRDALDKFVTFTKGNGIYSLSKTATDELLWAHYANSHQGFCLEFELEKLLEYKLAGEEVIEVEYSLKPPTVSILEFLPQTSLKKLAATKSLRWKYEEEIRICVGVAGLREYDFRALKAIYFGLRCNDRLIRLVMRLLRGRGLKYYQMQLLEGSYALEPVDLKDNYPDALPYRARIAPVDDGVPYLDEKTRPFEKEIRTAIEMARREPYCEKVTDAYLSLKSTPEKPVFYVTYDRSDGLPRNIFYNLKEIQAHELYV